MSGGLNADEVLETLLTGGGNAIRFYRAPDATQDDDVKKLVHALSQWEGRHHDTFSRMRDSSVESRAGLKLPDSCNETGKYPRGPGSGDRDFGAVRFLPRSLLIVGLVTLLMMPGCSHTSQYFRSDVSPLENVRAADIDVRQRILLVGDAGDTEVSGSTLTSLCQWAAEMPQETLLIFLGDNIYPAGMPEKGDAKRKDAEQRLSAQLAIIQESGVRGLFISGNHDWADDGKGGLQAVKRQEQYVNQVLGGDGNFLPRDGAPGPVKLDLNGVRVIVLNTAWWLHEEGAAASSNPQREKDSMIQELKKLLDGAAERDVIVVGHHPLASHGTQGGFYDWKDHLFPSTHLVRGLWIPTPILGSLYPLLRGHVFNKQTLAGSAYKDMRKRLTAVLSTNPPLIYAAGHDHGLQVLEGGSAAEYFLVSALGLDVGASLGDGEDTLFAHLYPGFMAVDFMEDGKALLRVIEPGDCGVVFSKWIKGGP